MATSLENEIGHGNTGLVPWSALGDVEENVPELSGLNAISTYNKMRQDAQIASLLLAFTLPIRRYRWYVEPNGARDQVVEWVAQNLSLPIAGQEDAPTGRRRDRFSHDRHLFHALLNLPFGHMYFEQVYRFDDAAKLYGLRKLAPRMPGSISEINVARDGGLDSIRQFPSGWTDVSKPSLILPSLQQKPIPVTQLVAYINEQEGGNWRGISWLRALYRHWLRKDRLLRVDAINGERNDAGVPMGYAPPNATDAQIKEIGALARSYRAGESAGGGLPNGADIRFKGVEGTLPKVLESIRYDDEQIAARFLGMFTKLGTTETGSRALGQTLVDFFALAQEAVAKQYADTTNEHVIGILPGVDYRGRGGYVVGPPSEHPDGHRYRWVNPLRDELARVAQWLIQLLVPERGPERPRAVPEGSRAYGLGALRRELQRLYQTREGSRNHQLNVASFNMGRLVAAGDIDETEAASALIEQGQRIGLGATECERTVVSGLGAGMQQPRCLGSPG